MNWRFWRSRHWNAATSSHDFSNLETAAFFVPTPWAVARQMLEAVETGPEDVVFDLGSGDGRIPIMAAQEFGSRAVGIESDPALCHKAAATARELGLQDRVSFRNESFFQSDFRGATVVTLYLLSAVNGQLEQRLASHLRAGARVIALDFDVPGWRVERTITAQSEGGVDYTLHLYRRSISAHLRTRPLIQATSGQFNSSLLSQEEMECTATSRLQN